MECNHRVYYENKIFLKHNIEYHKLRQTLESLEEIPPQFLYFSSIFLITINFQLSSHQVQ